MTPTFPTDPGPTDPGERGLTLLELLVVISVMALIAVSLPSLLARPASHGDTVRAVIADLRAARAEAVFSGGPIDMVLDLEQRRFGKGAADRDLPEGTEMTVTTAREITGQAPDARRARLIRFFPDGSASGGEIALATGPQTDVIQVRWLTGGITRVD